MFSVQFNRPVSIVNSDYDEKPLAIHVTDLSGFLSRRVSQRCKPAEVRLHERPFILRTSTREREATHVCVSALSHAWYLRSCA